jgi:mono/diheme cytochrome c family protein
MKSAHAACALVLSLSGAIAIAACSSDPSTLQRSHGESGSGTTATSGGPTASASVDGASTSTTPAPGTLPTASKAGEAFFAKELQPLLSQTCGGCHVAGGPGNPTWIDAGDAKKTYDMIYLQAYATATSRIVVKGPHSNGAAPALSTEERTKWAQWIALEAKEPGKPAQASVLEKFGDCFDKALFDAIDFGKLEVTGRTPKNNPQALTEDQDRCTGCRDATKCNTCHSSDDVTGFVMAVGNNIFPADYTFESTKKLSPPFIREYVGTTPTGEPTYNPGLKSKSTNTVEKALAYQHPMFLLSDDMEVAIKAFVDAAITKYKAGLCGK